MSEVVDAGWIQIWKSVAVYIHSLKDPDHLHKVRDGLPSAVGKKKNGPRRGNAEAFIGVDNMVAVLVDAAPPGREGHRATANLVDRHCAKRAETGPDRVDSNRGDPMRRHCRGHVKGEVFVLVVAVAENRHWPSAGGL